MAIGLFALSDLSYAIFLSGVILNLKMQQRRKVILTTFMVMSHLLATGAILVRLFIAIAYTEVSALTDYASMANAFANSERCLVIIMGCAPTLRSVADMDYSLPGAASPADVIIRSRRLSLNRGVDRLTLTYVDEASSIGPETPIKPPPIYSPV